jgi:hypothetical protein
MLGEIPLGEKTSHGAELVCYLLVGENERCALRGRICQ